MKNKQLDSDFVIIECEILSDFLAGFDVVQQLYPQLNFDEYSELLVDMINNGYKQIQLFEGDQCIAVAGYTIRARLCYKRVLEVEDLVVDQTYRSRGIAKKLLIMLSEKAKSAGCDTTYLHSGNVRKDAHRFYIREGFDQNALHFCKKHVA